MFPVLSCNRFAGKAWKISLVMSVKNKFDNKMFGHFDMIIFNKPKIQNVSVKFIFTLTFLFDIHCYICIIICLQILSAFS